MPTSRRKIWTNNKGFTLIEMLVVIAILALIATFTIPKVASILRESLKSASRNMGSTIRQAYNSTMITGKVHRVAYDLKNHTYWVEVGPESFLLDATPAEEKERARPIGKETKKEDDTDEDEQTEKKSEFKLDEVVTRKKIQLPTGVTFTDILTEENPEPIKEGITYTHFFPNGVTERTVVHLIDSSNQKLSIIISPLLGRTEIRYDYVTRAEAFN